jgi:hypothetical protein
VRTTDCRCCDECEHDVFDVTARGMMPPTADGREVRVLIARDVSSCLHCHQDQHSGDAK